SPDHRGPSSDLPPALLAFDTHAVAHLHQAALLRAPPFYGDETFKTDPHHAKRRAGALRDRRPAVPDIVLAQDHGRHALMRAGAHRSAVDENREGFVRGIDFSKHNRLEGEGPIG